jgi:hypothetical protein
MTPMQPPTPVPAHLITTCDSTAGGGERVPNSQTSSIAIAYGAHKTVPQWRAASPNQLACIGWFFEKIRDTLGQLSVVITICNLLNTARGGEISN